MSKLRQGLESLEQQLDLPAQAISHQHGGRRKFCGRESGEHDHVPGELRGIRLDLPALAAGFLADTFQRDLDRFFRLADRSDAI